jgi:hypothetical protein
MDGAGEIVCSVFGDGKLNPSATHRTIDEPASFVYPVGQGFSNQFQDLDQFWALAMGNANPSHGLTLPLGFARRITPSEPDG